MYNLGDDNELDRASRDAAARFTPPGDPDWQALSAELDKVLPVEEKKRRGFFFWWLLPVLLIGGGAAYWLMQKESAPVVTAAKEVATTKTDTKETGTTSPVESSVTTQKENSIPATNQTEQQKPTVQVDKQTAKKNVLRIDEKIDVSGNGSLSLSARKNKTNPVTTPAKEQPVVNNNISPATEQPVKQDPVVSTVTTNTATDPANQSAKNSTEQPAQPAIGNNTPVTESRTTTVPVVELSQAAPEIKSPATTPTLLQKRGKGFSLGVVAGIDKSTVKFTYGDDAGVNIGLLAGYHFSDRLSLHTGAIYTQKNYKVAGPDFTAPKGSWASYYKIDNVEGFCRMWEVPLLARYTISQSNKKSVFLSTGLSSYFMTHENYDYTYYTNAGLLATRNSAYNSGDTHILSILHLSAGFENRISRSLSLQVEPYAKIPMSGLGFGNISLSSFGLNFSLQLRQPAKK